MLAIQSLALVFFQILSIDYYSLMHYILLFSH
nr:MAG TPA: hypothetical protein [Caudoviricetes sp.]